MFSVQRREQGPLALIHQVRHLILQRPLERQSRSGLELGGEDVLLPGLDPLGHREQPSGNLGLSFGRVALGERALKQHLSTTVFTPEKQED